MLTNGGRDVRYKSVNESTSVGGYLVMHIIGALIVLHGDCNGLVSDSVFNPLVFVALSTRCRHVPWSNSHAVTNQKSFDVGRLSWQRWKV